MNNAEKKLYIVSFGHSDSYTLMDTEEGAKATLARVESELNKYLTGLYPENTFAYYTTPRITEVDPAHADRYAGYAPLDESAVARIEKVLSEEVANMNDQAQLDSDAPFSNVNPAAAGLTGLL
ncbi:MAG: hypothetical protein K2H86_08745 [Muribaculaceae bacterium]|nr:hypothetical protein [Muribaculaceae bacterium]